MGGLRSLQFVVKIVITNAVDAVHGVKAVNGIDHGDKGSVLHGGVNAEEQGVNELIELKQKFECMELAMNTLQDETVKLRKERKEWKEHKESGDGILSESILCDDVHDPNDPEWDF